MSALRKLIVGGIRIALENVQSKYRLFHRWQGKHHMIRNWLLCWAVSTSLIVDLAFRLARGRRFLARRSIYVHFRNGMKLKFTADKWHDLIGFVETCDTYMSGIKVELQENDLVVDVGAHVGTFCVPLAFNRPGLRVYAFEPDPENYVELAENVRINSIKPGELQIHQLAIYSSPGIYPFSVGATSTTGAISETGFYKIKADAEQIDCRATTLGEFFRENSIEHCKLLKMDCEGSEYEILENMALETIDKIENMILEVHVVRGREPLALKAMLESKGYKIAAVPHRNGCWDLYCNRPRPICSPPR